MAMKTSVSGSSVLRLLHESSRLVFLLRKALASAASEQEMDEWEALTLLRIGEIDSGIVQRDLVKWLHVSPAQVSGVVERLRQRMWAVSERSKEDRRRQVWRLTPMGRECYRSLIGSLQKDISPIAGDLDLENLDLIIQQLGNLSNLIAMIESSSLQQEGVAA